jgi:Ca2+/Na+ antiporter
MPPLINYVGSFRSHEKVGSMRSVRDSLLFSSFVFTTALLLLSCAYAVGKLSPGELCVGLILLMLCFYIWTLLRLRRRSLRSENVPLIAKKEMTPQMERSWRKLRRLVVILPILLVVGLWGTQGQPLLPRLVAAAINIFITGYLISLLWRAKRQMDS